jgi:hypothetical protein
VSERRRRADEILGATVVLTAWSSEREAELAEALGRIAPKPVDLGTVKLPFVALAKASLVEAESAKKRLEAAGGVVELRDAWVTRDERPVASARPACPFCGSTKTQPYVHAGPGARKSMKCTTCGQRFKV